MGIVKNSKIKYGFGISKQKHKKALALLLLVCICFISTSCDKAKEWLNKGQMEGFWGTNYISPDVSNTKEKIEGSFEIKETDNYTLRLVLTRKDTSSDYRKTGRKLAEFQIEDSEEMIKLIDIVKGIEVRIKNDNFQYNINEEDIIAENTSDSDLYGNIMNGIDTIQISLAYPKLQKGNYFIEMEAQNVILYDWKAQFVLGTGAQGSELIW